MRTFFTKTLITTLILLSGLSIFASFPQRAAACSPMPGCLVAQGAATVLSGKANASTFAAAAFEYYSIKLVEGVLKITSLLTALGGILLNTIVYYTVVKVSEGYNISSIAGTWQVVRDLANMGFIFILLYAAIMTIVGQGQDNRKLIINIVVVAVLINFSLFFTKVVIDIANLIALTFYDSIAPGALSASANEIYKQAGLSNAFMQHLNVQSLYNSGSNVVINAGNLLTIGIMGSILLLITAFVFFAVSLLFIIRYVVLIIVMVLSPIFFIVHILPKGTEMDKYKNQWKNALIGQAFFAPIYFAITWVALNILAGMEQVFGGAVSAQNGLGGAALKASTLEGGTQLVTLLLNFSMVIIMVVTALVVAKQYADKAGSGINGLTKWATGAAMGAAGFVGRNSVGRASQRFGESEWLKNKAANGSFVGKFAAQQAIKGTKNIGGSSFDLRATKLGGTLDGGKAGGKGGFADYRKKKAEAEAKFASSLAPSGENISRAEIKLNKTKEEEERITREAAERVDREFKVPSVLEKLEKDAATAEKMAQNTTMSQASRDQANQQAQSLKTQAKRIRDDYETRRQARITKILSETGVVDRKHQAQQKVDNMKGYDDDRAREILKQEGNYTPSKQEIAAVKKRNKGAGDQRKNAYADTVRSSYWAKIRGYNHTAANQIRKGKDAKDKLAEAAKELAKADSEDETPPAAPAAPATPPSAPPTP